MSIVSDRTYYVQFSEYYKYIIFIIKFLARFLYFIYKYFNSIICVFIYYQRTYNLTFYFLAFRLIHSLG